MTEHKGVPSHVSVTVNRQIEIVVVPMDSKNVHQTDHQNLETEARRASIIESRLMTLQSGEPLVVRDIYQPPGQNRKISRWMFESVS